MNIIDFPGPDAAECALCGKLCNLRPGQIICDPCKNAPPPQPRPIRAEAPHPTPVPYRAAKDLRRHLGHQASMKTRPWNKIEHVPFNCWIRNPSFPGSGNLRTFICAVSVEGFSYFSGDSVKLIQWGSPKIERLEWTVDGVTWQRCEVTE